MSRSDKEIQAELYQLYRIALEQRKTGDASARERVRYYGMMINRHNARMHRKRVTAQVNA